LPELSLKARAISRDETKDQDVQLRIVLVDPPPNVAFALQCGRSELHQVTRSTGKSLSFDFALRARHQDGGEPNWLGAFAQGTRASRFVYVNSGTYAGDKEACWSRRAKVSLIGITREQLDQLQRGGGAVLEVRIAGTSSDGGPACASVPPLDQGWYVVDDSRARRP
jgi:hypothetical protein